MARSSSGAGRSRSLIKADAQRAAAKLIVDGDLVLYGPVGGDFFGEAGFQAREVVDALSTVTGDITVRINSGGGDVFQGFAIHNALVAHKGHVTVKVDGLAASAASVIAMAADHVVVPSTASLMIHNAWAFAVGGADELRKQADVLDKINGQIRTVYAKASGQSPAWIKRAMDAETWMTGEEAVRAGFADTTTDEPSAPPSPFNYAAYRNVPDAVLEAAEAAERGDGELTERQIERALQKAGISRSRAREIVSRGCRKNSRPREDQRAAWKQLSTLIDTLAKEVRTCGAMH